MTKSSDNHVQHRLLTGQEVERMFGISHTTFVTNFLRDPSFPRIEIGKSYRFPTWQILEWVDERAINWFRYRK